MKKTKVTVACCALIAPLAFCASAFAGPSENVVQPATQQPVTKTVRKMCFVVESGSRIPQREGDITLWYAEANAVSKTSV